MTMTRAQLLRSIRFDDEVYRWSDSYHETESWAFVPAGKKVKCDACFKEIEAGKLYSIGSRQINVDAPIYSDWTDKVHAECSDYKSVEEALKNSSPWTFAGFSSLPKEEKINYLKIAGITEPTEEMLKSVKPLTGMTCVVMGDFSTSRESIRQEIEEQGGVCIETPTKQHDITHIVLGKPGKTPYGQPIGKGSKKYKDLMKRKPKPIVVDYDFVTKIVKSGKNIFDEEEETEATEKQESEENTEKQTEEKPRVKKEEVKTEETKKEEDKKVKKEEKVKQEVSKEEEEEESSEKKSEEQDKSKKRVAAPVKKGKKEESEEEEEAPKKRSKKESTKKADKKEESEEEEAEEEEKEKEKPKPKRKAESKEKSDKKQKVEIDVDKLDVLKRQRLQSLAKKHGIKANGKSEDIIQALKDLAASQKE